ncbi:bifunctional metallophosphatase/5'-nucleotidase [Alkalibacterium sp. MB6]|uniref:bifunctional metallophosphatase/5'-nucleotidase n=1 Tax=Alkalibacterium sp. MB6 TaxID=2081965 RepID=UPI00137AC8E3|nr:bifunctional UDP-sugar hydrolase/5'-nucleotidase [Alkalibacterium sp. MB6]
MKITLFQTSDIHGYLFPTDYQSREQKADYGLFKLATLLDKERAKSEGPTLTIENGDFIQGSPLSYYVVKEKKTAKELMEALNHLNFDAGVIGNHEFNYGLDYLHSAIKEANFPVLCANILNESGQPAWGQPYKVFEKEGIKIAVLGLTTQYIPNWEHPENYDGLTFKSAVEVAKEFMPILKKEADIVVVSYHGGFERDLVSGKETEVQTGENEGYALLHEVEGIDVLFTGHQHRVIAQTVNGTAVVMPGDKGSYLGKVSIDVEKTDEGILIHSITPEVVPVNEEADDTLMQAYQSLNDEVEDWLDRPIGDVLGDMEIKDVERARREEHPYVEFVHRVQMHYTGCDISGTALFNNDAKGFKQTVTMRDIVLNYIYPNTLAVMTVSGADLKVALERSATYFSLSDAGEVIVNPEFLNPKPQMYNYDMYEGVEYVIDVAQAEGERVVEFKYKGKDIKPDDQLEIVINQYRAVGGGNYHMFDASKIIREVTIPMTELIGDYFSEFTPVEATVNHNFKVINSTK